MSAPISPERVLPTLNADGTRHKIRPRLYTGPIHSRRKWAAWGLMFAFVALPFARIGGKPAMLLDVAHREFTFFGHTFYATDGVFLMLLLLSIFVSIFWITALVGRAWCGYACPQTVYMEFLFRPIERWFEGSREAQLRLDKRGLSARRVAKNVVFLGLSALLGNAFLAYFVGTDALTHWISRSPVEHPSAFLVMAATTGLVFLDFAYFREQLCTVACPYARLQSVLLDKRSLIIGYDSKRGEPRGKGKPKPGDGDCIDCNACVVTCPTGIDIREGLQLECIACGQCADACDSIMNKIKKPQGLIRYGSQLGFATGKQHSLLRPRVVAYPALLSVLLIAMVTLGSQRSDVQLTVLRGLGAPFTQQGGEVISQIRVKIENRSSEAQDFQIDLQKADGAKLIAPENPLHVKSREQRTTSLFVVSPKANFHKGERSVVVHVKGASLERSVPFRLLGPTDGGLP
ncbi:MAG TPA: cytochrome c oxidase accessory protein CcoG [Polyangiaceae bacterium]|nr:cytochrome c oxidase accessory protein CcoG [Polyangiaceae bacterium]